MRTKKFNHSRITEIIIDLNAFIEVNGNNKDIRDFLKTLICKYLDDNRITLKEYLFLYRFITDCEF